MEAPKKLTTDGLEERLKKAGIDPQEFADLLWPLLKSRVVPMLKHMAQQHCAKRQDLLAAAVSGMAVRWNGESAQRMAELAERLVDAVMREEEKRMP